MNVRFVQSEKINARTTRQLLTKIETAYPARHVRLHVLPKYAPHLNPIERLWGVMHSYVTHNAHYPDFGRFLDTALRFFRETIPRKWRDFRDTVTDNFRVISHEKHQIIQW